MPPLTAANCIRSSPKIAKKRSRAMPTAKTAKVGQAIVKQSWVPDEVTGEIADAVARSVGFATR